MRHLNGRKDSVKSKDDRMDSYFGYNILYYYLVL